MRHARGCLRATLPLYLAVFQQALHATAVRLTQPQHLYMLPTLTSIVY